MLIYRDNGRWAWLTGFAIVGASIGYALYVRTATYGPSGGSWPGLIFGSTASALMLLAALLSVRKAVRTWRIGSAQLWMKMHIWGGILAVPLIWFHSGFALGGRLTTTLMILFYIVTLSGIVGLVLQQFVPAWMTQRVPLETIHSQIDHVVAGLAVDAYELVSSLAGVIPEAAEEQAALHEQEQAAVGTPANWKNLERRKPAQQPAAETASLRTFYIATLRPFLRHPNGRGLTPPDFHALAIDAPDDWHASLERLKSICEEVRQLRVQRRWHGLLHNWLFFHGPVSVALLLLALAHAIMALRF